MTHILMPALSPSMETATIARWLKREGDEVLAGEIIAEIETDKSTVEFEAERDGFLTTILMPEGSEVPVNTPIAILTHGEPAAPEAAILVASDHRPEREASMSDLLSAAVDTYRGNRIFASPLARMKAREIDISLEALIGSGPGGRIIERDIRVERETRMQDAHSEIGQTRSEAGTLDVPTNVGFAADRSESPVVNLPGKSALKQRNMEPQSAPAFYVTVECEAEPLLSICKQLNEAAPIILGGPAYQLESTDLLIKAWTQALSAVPRANVSWVDGEIYQNQHADIHLADKFGVTVIHQAETKTVSRISAERRAALSDGVSLPTDQSSNGSTTIHYFGVAGIMDFLPMIAPSQTTALGIIERMDRHDPTTPLNGRATLKVCLAADGRAIDSLTATRIASEFKSLVERPLLALC